MSYNRVSLGNPIPLRLQLGDGNTGKFPRAHIYDSAHAEVAGSPFDLVHIGNGLYADESFTPVATEVFDASYTVYSDAGHTIIDAAYTYAMDVFDVLVTVDPSTLLTTAHFDAVIGTPANVTIAADLAEIEADIDLIPTTRSTCIIEGVIVQSDITGTVIPEELIATVDEC